MAILGQFYIFFFVHFFIGNKQIASNQSKTSFQTNRLSLASRNSTSSTMNKTLFRYHFCCCSSLRLFCSSFCFGSFKCSAQQQSDTSPARRYKMWSVRIGSSRFELVGIGSNRPTVNNLNTDNNKKKQFHNIRTSHKDSSNFVRLFLGGFLFFSCDRSILAARQPFSDYLSSHCSNCFVCDCIDRLPRSEAYNRVKLLFFLFQVRCVPCCESFSSPLSAAVSSSFPLLLPTSIISQSMSHVVL